MAPKESWVAALYRANCLRNCLQSSITLNKVSCNSKRTLQWPHKHTNPKNGANSIPAHKNEKRPFILWPFVAMINGISCRYLTYTPRTLLKPPRRPCGINLVSIADYDCKMERNNSGNNVLLLLSRDGLMNYERRRHEVRKFSLFSHPSQCTTENEE